VKYGLNAVVSVLSTSCADASHTWCGALNALQMVTDKVSTCCLEGVKRL